LSHTRFAALLLLLALGLTVPLAFAQAEPVAPVPLDEYWQRIETLADSLAGAEENERAITAAARELAAIEAVLLPDGQAIPVDNHDLLEILRRDDLNEDDLQAARARLEALQRTRQYPVPTTDQTFERLDEILSRSEFERATVGRTAKLSPLQRALEWLAGKLERAGGAPGVRPLLTLLSVAVTLAALLYFFRSSWSQWASEGWSAGQGRGADETSLSSSEARARALSAGDDYRQAARYLYLSTLLWLDERGLLHYDPACTNREFLQQVSGNNNLHEALLPVVNFFDRVWYGFAPLDGRAYAAFGRQVEQVRKLGGQE
jgi:hypothetical protein